MNFAFVTVLLLLVTLPGITFRRSYYASRFSLNYISTNLLNELIWAIIPAIFLHAIAILLIEKYSNHRIDLECFGYLVVGGNDKEEIHKAFTTIQMNIGNIFLYFTTITFFSFLLGTSGRLIVRGFGLDIYIKILRFPNRWHYLFTGEYLDFERGWKYHENIDFIIADILMQVGDECIIYSGILEEYYLSKTSGGLDSIMIKYPSKKSIKSNGSSEYREIPGNYLSIPFEKILNINIQYYEFEGDDEIKEIEEVEEKKEQNSQKSE
jgi:hypothetical protein